MLKMTMYHRNRCTSQPGRKQATAKTPTDHGGRSREAPRKMIRFGWNEKCAGAKTSNRLPTAQSAAATMSKVGSSWGPAPTASSTASAPAASTTTPGM